MSWISTVNDKWLGIEKGNMPLSQAGDKLIKPEDKDNVEYMGTAAILIALGVPPGYANVIAKAGNNKQINALDIIATVATAAGPDSDIAKFFNSDLGKSITGLLSIGNIGGANGLLDSLGMSDKSKDFIEYMATTAILTALGDKLAEGKLKKAAELENKEFDLVTDMVNTAQMYDDPKFKAQAVSLAKENVTNQFQQAREEHITGLYQRGMGRRTTGGTSYLARKEAEDKLVAQRDIEQALPLQGLQAQATAVGPLSNLTQRTRAGAEEARLEPLNAYLSYLEASKGSTYDDYLKAQIAQKQGQAEGTASVDKTTAIMNGIAAIGGFVGAGTTGAGTGVKSSTGAQQAGANLGGTVIKPKSTSGTQIDYLNLAGTYA